MNALNHWEQRPLGKCGEWLSGGTPPKQVDAYWGGDIPWISAKSLNGFELRDAEDRLTQAGAENGSRVVPAGSVLFLVRGMSLAREFKVGLTMRDVAFNQDVKAIVPAPDIEGRYLAHFLRACQSRVLGMTDTASHGTKKLGTDTLAALAVPLPAGKNGKREQKRIADILDQADALRAKRRAALAQLDTLTQAIFLEMFGRPLRGDEKWPLSRVGEVGRVQLGRQRAPQYQTGRHKTPYVRVANVFEDRIDLTDVLSMDFDSEDFAAYRLQYGDILLNEGQSTELVGRPAMWRSELDRCCFQNTLVRFQAYPDRVLPEFALGVFVHYFRSGEFSRISSKTSSVAHLGASRFAAMPFPVPPLSVQAEFARRMAAASAQKARFAKSLTKLDALFASLQHRAFRGEL